MNSTDEQQCQGVREKRMKKVLCLAKSIGTFSFLEKDRNTIYKNFSLQAAATIPTLFSVE